MKKILMSFWPSVYDRIVAQTKLIEFRRRYSDEETLVYMYITSPCMEIKGLIELGKRIDMTKVPMDSAFYSQAIHDGYKPDQYLYGMPIRSVQVTNSLTLADIRAHIPRFVAPRSYYNLSNAPELLHLIEKRITPLSKRCYNTIEIL